MSVVDELAGYLDRVAELPRAADDAERIDRIAVLEKLNAAVYAAQLDEVDEFSSSQRAANTAKGLKGDRARRGIAEQVGRARKASPVTAAKQLSHAKALRCALPHTFALLRRGEISAWVATIVVNETSHLAAEDRRLVDAELAEQLSEYGPKKAGAEARRLAIEADPAAAVARASNARKDRRVGIRPAPDTMAILSALVPCEQGVAAYGALRRHADALVAAGDKRSRNQIMADTVVERLTGQANAEAVSAEIGLVMTDLSLLGDDETPAEMHGYGPIPAEIARNLARNAADQHHNGCHDGGCGDPASGAGSRSGDDGDSDDRRCCGANSGCAVSEVALNHARVWVRRLFTDPATGILRDCDPRRRRFDGVLATLLSYRDRVCRDEFCDAPIREFDHIHSYAAAGPTTADNGRGVCQRGNHSRQMPGWDVRVVDPDRHIVQTTTPTGHTYRSAPPAAPGVRLRRTRTPDHRRAGPERTL